VCASLHEPEQLVDVLRQLAEALLAGLQGLQCVAQVEGPLGDALLQLGDIGQDDDGALQLAAPVMDRCGAGQQPAQAGDAIPFHLAAHHNAVHCLTAQRPRHRRGIRLQGLPTSVEQSRPLQPLGQRQLPIRRREAEERAGRGVGARDPAVRIVQDDTVGDGGNDGVEHRGVILAPPPGCLRLGQQPLALALGLLLRGNVAKDAYGARDAAFRPEDGRGRNQQPPAPVAGQDDVQLHVPQRLAVHGRAGEGQIAGIVRPALRVADHHIDVALDLHADGHRPAHHLLGDAIGEPEPAPGIG